MGGNPVNRNKKINTEISRKDFKTYITNMLNDLEDHESIMRKIEDIQRTI